MADHPNARGYKPQIRVYIPHQKEYCKIKLAQLGKLALLKLKANEMGCPDSGMWYVDTAGCGMLQANDANPPPKHGFVRNAMRYAAVLLFGLMLLVGSASCNKDPQPTPEIITTDTIPDIPGDTILPPVPPIDTIQPDTIVPGPGGDTIVPGGGKVVKFYYQGASTLPSLDTIRRYANDPEYDSIYIMWIAPANYWTPVGFHSARDSLSKRFNISPKVYGGMTIRPYEIVPDADSLSPGVKGMARCDSVWYADRHYNVWPVNKSAQSPRYNGNRVLKAGRSR